MKTISRTKLVALWICLLYFIAILVMAIGKALTAFFRIGSEYKGEVVPRSTFMSVVQSAQNDFWFGAFLIGFGVVFLGAVTLWITAGGKVERPLQKGPETPEPGSPASRPLEGGSFPD